VEEENVPVLRGPVTGTEEAPDVKPPADQIDRWAPGTNGLADTAKKPESDKWRDEPTSRWRRIRARLQLWKRSS
jgi:hypothetical protein